MAIITKNTWQIFAVKGAASDIYFWQLENLLTGNIHMYPVENCTLDVENQSTTDYTFIWNKDQIHSLQIDIIDVKYIGNGSGTPNYGAVATDLASILALI